LAHQNQQRFAPTWANKTHSSGALYEQLYELWKEFIPIDQFDSFRKGGYYSVLLGRNLRLIVLNTQLCFRLNLWNVIDPVDPSDQLKWLTEQLAEAEQLDQQVHLLGHIAPDQRACTSVWLHNFVRILGRFEHTIKAQFYGHNHLDEVRLYWSRTAAKKLHTNAVLPFELDTLGKAHHEKLDYHHVSASFPL
jgi:sphingomyelin phosphodiesterase